MIYQAPDLGSCSQVPYTLHGHSFTARNAMKCSVISNSFLTGTEFHHMCVRSKNYTSTISQLEQKVYSTADFPSTLNLFFVPDWILSRINANTQYTAALICKEISSECKYLFNLILFLINSSFYIHTPQECHSHLVKWFDFRLHYEWKFACPHTHVHRGIGKCN